MKIARALAFLLLVAAPASALPPSKALAHFAHDVWQAEQGLPQNYINDVVQTRDGYLWLATEEGLVRFDGARFTLFDRRNTDALADHNVQALYAAPDGTLWIGTRAGGLVSLKDGVFTRYTAANGLSDARILAITSDRTGAIWIGTNGGGLNRFEHGRFTAFTTKDGLTDNRVIEVAADPAGDLWIGTVEGGVTRMIGGTLRAVDDELLRGQTVVAIVPARDGTVWLGTHRGLVRWRGGRFERHDPATVGAMRVIALAEDRDGTIWVGTNGGGLAALRGDRVERFQAADGLSNDTVLGVAEDREGSLWIATGGGGLNRLRDASFTPITKRDGLPHEIAMATFEDRDGAIWVGTYGGGVGHIRDGVVETVDLDPLLSRSVVNAIAQDAGGALWFGTGASGLFRVDAQRRVTRVTKADGLPHDGVYALVAAGSDVWAGTRGGLARISGSTVTAFTSREWLMNDFVRALAADADGTIWIGTNGGGLLRFRDGEMIAPVKTDGLAAFIRAIHHDADGTLWLGTSGGGLVRAQPAGQDYRVAVFTTRDGLADDVVYQILDDGRGYLWLSSNKGIARVAKASIDARARGAAPLVESRLFGKSDGMLSVECNGGFQPAGVRARDGRLWFPTVRGVVSVAPERLVTNALAPPVAVEEVLADRAERRLELHYTALSLVEPSRVRFQYRLDGLDGAWIDVGNRRAAYYTNVPAGRYVFRVRAANNDGVWNERGTAYPVAFDPRFYETAWFYGLCLVAAVAVVSGGVRLRARQSDAREVELLRQVDERTSQLQDANHQLEQLSYLDPLTGIANRRRFEDTLRDEWRRAYRTEQSLAILMIDLDRFKSYNDTFGHVAGDECLATVARTLSHAVLRAGDLVARYGGEEFAAILIGADLGGATDVAERLRAAVEALGLGLRDDRRKPATISVGVAAARPRDGDSAEVLVAAADRALYQAKAAGRNAVKTARPGIQ